MNGPRDLIATIFDKADKVSRKAREDRYALTTFIDPDLVFLDGKGSRITVLDHGQRRSLIDASAGVSTKNIGYGNDMVKRAMRNILREYKDFTGYPHHDMENDIALNLAWILAELTPLKAEREVVFGNSGAQGLRCLLWRVSWTDARRPFVDLLKANSARVLPHQRLPHQPHAVSGKTPLFRLRRRWGGSIH